MRIIIVIAGLLLPGALASGNNHSDPVPQSTVKQWMQVNSHVRFCENKGQMANTEGKVLSSLLFKVHGNGMDLYVTTTGLSYVFYKVTKPANSGNDKNNFHVCVRDSGTVNYCRADMNLVDADIRKENIVKEYESNGPADYYLGHCKEGVMNVHSYQRVTIKNIYPGIDWVLYSSVRADNKKNTGGFKYDFIVHPGAEVSQIRLRYKWTDNPQLQKNGSVEINTPFGNIIEGIPLSYCKGKENNIPTRYTVADNEIKFTVDQYDPADTLIIDPSLIWATFYGGNGEEGTSIHSDGTNVWVTGTVTGNNFPEVNPGGGAYFQGTLGFGREIFILKFTTSGVLIWAAYYGDATHYNASYSIYSDGISVWITGDAVGPNFSTLNPGGGAYYQSSLGAGSTYGNVFILQFSVSGVRKWATYYGAAGSPGDIGYSICSDGTNVWITGITSALAFPVMNPGGGVYFQAAPVSGSQSAFILQFTTGGVRKWATFYGGDKWSRGKSIKSDGTNVWVAGYTGSTNFPVMNPGGGAFFQGALNGFQNGFILKFNTSGVRQWSTYYGGSDKSNGDEFTSISSDGTNVWVTGATASTDFPTLNPGAGAYFQGTLAGATGWGFSNAIILQFNTSCVRKWATYYGGSGNSTTSYRGDMGSSIQGDGTNVWLTGSTVSSDFPTYNADCGSFFQGTFGSKKRDVFLLQFNTSGVRKWATYYGGAIGNDLGSCISSDGSNLWLSAYAFKGDKYPTLNPGGGTYFIDTIAGENIFIAKFCISCPSSAITLSLNPAVTICKGGSTKLSASGATSYSWSPSAGLNATDIPDPVASPAVTTSYTVTGTTGTCTGTATVVVTVSPASAIKISVSAVPGSVKPGETTQLTATGSSSYTWSPANTLSCATCDKPLAAPKTSTWYTVTTKDANGCTVEDSVYVKVEIPCGDFFIPTAFSPNNDGANDLFYIRTKCISDFLLQVFDRWGEKVFESTDVSNSWNGTYAGKPLNTAVFVYRVSGVNSVTGEKIDKRGNLTLLR